MSYLRRASPLHATRASIGAAYCAALVLAALLLNHPLILGALAIAVALAAIGAGVGRRVLRSLYFSIPMVVLLVLVICAIGERLGLAAAKTAFFLGLFMSRAHFQGQSVEEYIAPISRRFLIPIFFMSLGLLIDARMVFSYTALLALCGSFLLIGFREVMHRRWLKTGGDAGAYLLLCPKLTMAALAATTLLHSGSRDAATWVVLSGLFMSVISLLLLPRVVEEKL